MAESAADAAASSEPAPEDSVPAARRTPWQRSRLLWITLEALAAVVPAGLFSVWANTIDVDPIDRIGQVSGLAALQFRFAIVAIVLVVAMLCVHRWGSPVARDLAKRLGCAAVAGLATGLIAGGMVMALRGTPYALWAGESDYRPILAGVTQVRAGGEFPSHYPPLFPYLMGYWSDISGKKLVFGLKDLQLLFTALFGPAAYLSWRMILRPVWALAIGVLAMLPFVEPVKPYENIALVVLVPVLIAFVRLVRRSASLEAGRGVRLGLAYGIGLGLLFLLYSGWFVWFALGTVAAIAVVVPWRTGLARAGVLLGTTSAAFLVVSWIHLRGLFSNSGAISDSFFYVDTCTDPTYIAMWVNDRPFTFGSVWPPLGEFAGVGLFTLLLAAGAALALALGWRRSPVLVAGLGIVGAWLVRMYLASEMYATGTVRLYPRTLLAILHCLLILTGLGVFYAFGALAKRFGGRLTSAPLGLLLIPLLFVVASAGSATIDKYLPDEHRDSFGWAAWIAQTKPADHHCSPYGALHGCGTRGIGSTGGTCGPSKQPIPVPRTTPVVTPLPSPAPTGSPTPRPGTTVR